ncbi:hypothetical protein QJQ45_028206 [Haematococcus lacustris]|nr:hypothetical protein QJQ45_028206 [Haematococcus lacustris]
MVQHAGSVLEDGLLAKSGLPVWLNPDRFLAADFEPDACVADLRRFLTTSCLPLSHCPRQVPLNTLQVELQNYLATLKARVCQVNFAPQMVEVINEDYSDYVSLSSRLVNVDGAVVRMRKPLCDLKDKLVVVQEAVQGELTALAAGLQRRKEVATARSMLELLQELAHVAGKVDKLLAEVAASTFGGSSSSSSPPENGASHASSSPTGSTQPVASNGAGQAAGGTAGQAAPGEADLDARARLLERVAGEVSRLTYQANRGKDLAFVKALEPKVAAARAELSAHLATALEAALLAGSHAAALHCLHAYAELGQAGPAEAAVRKLVVAPAVESVLHDHKAVHTIRMSATATAGREEGLGGLLSKMLARIEQAAGHVLAAALTPQSPLRAFDFLGNALLAEVDMQLAAQLPSTFSPGVPAAFHANFLAAQAFLDKLEQHCQGRTALERLRASPAYSSFAKRWNLSVYFSLLYQEIAGELEDAISSGWPDRAAPPQGPASVVLPASAAAVAALVRLASPQLLLRPLADRRARAGAGLHLRPWGLAAAWCACRFLRLALQLGARYSTWLASLATLRQEAFSQAMAAGAAAAPPSLATAPPSSSLAPPGPPSHLAASAPGQSAGSANAFSASAARLGTGAGQSGGGEGKAPPPSIAWVTQVPVEDLAVVFVDAAAVVEHVRASFTPAFTRFMATAGLLQPGTLDNGGGGGGGGGRTVAAVKGAGSAGQEGPGVGVEALSPGEDGRQQRQAGQQEGLVEVVEQVLGQLADGLEKQAHSVLSVMGDEVVEACVVVVKQLKGITATYRMTTKGPPTRHSHYVTGALVPMRNLLESPKLARLPTAARTQLVTGIAAAVCARYQALAEELLTTVRKTESSLKRLKKAQQADAGDGSAMSDSDKITLQLHLDVAEFGQQLVRFGVQPEQLEAYRRLQGAVGPVAAPQA